MKLSVIVRWGVDWTRVVLRRHPHIIASFAWVRHYWWLIFFAAAIVVTVRQPNADKLDPGSIFALAGLAVVVLSLTFPVILLIVQNLSQRSLKDLLDEFKRRGPWKEPMRTQAAAIVLIVTGGLWHATVSTGAGALLVLLALFGEGYGAFRRILDEMSPITLLNHLVDRRAAQIRAYRRPDSAGVPAAEQEAARTLEAVLAMAEMAIASADLELLRLTLDRVADLCTACMDVGVSFGDSLSELLAIRLASILEAAARSSTSVALPEVTTRIGTIGATIAGYQRDGFIAPGGIPSSIADLLAEALSHGHPDKRSSAPAQAIRGITSIGNAYIGAGRVSGTNHLIDKLRAIALAAIQARDQLLARQASLGLLEIAHVLTIGNTPGDPISVGAIERVSHALVEVATADADGHLPGAGTWIVNPIDWRGGNLGSITVRLLCWVMATKNDRRRQQYVRPAQTLFHASASLASSAQADVESRDNAVRIVTGIILAALGESLQDALPRVLEEWWTTAITLLVENEHAGESLTLSEYYLAELLLTAFYKSQEDSPTSSAFLRRLIDAALDKIATQPENDRLILSPVIRLLGAAAIKKEVFDLARACADAVLPPPAADNDLFHAPNVLFYAPYLSDEFTPWPSRTVSGIEFPLMRADHNDSGARRQFLDLENSDMS